MHLVILSVRYSIPPMRAPSQSLTACLGLTCTNADVVSTWILKRGHGGGSRSLRHITRGVIAHRHRPYRPYRPIPSVRYSLVLVPRRCSLPKTQSCSTPETKEGTDLAVKCQSGSAKALVSACSYSIAPQLFLSVPSPMIIAPRKVRSAHHRPVEPNPAALQFQFPFPLQHGYRCLQRSRSDRQACTTTITAMEQGHVSECWIIPDPRLGPSPSLYSTRGMTTHPRPRPGKGNGKKSKLGA